MKETILKKGLTNVKPVQSVSKQQVYYRCISDPTLERSLTSAKAVANVLMQWGI